MQRLTVFVGVISIGVCCGTATGAEERVDQLAPEVAAKFQKWVEAFGSGDRKAADEALANFVTAGKEATPVLVSALAHENRTVRRYAAEALCEVGDDRAVKPLVKALKDESSLVRRAAALGLGKFRLDSTIAPLTEAATKDEDFLVKNAAARSLCKFESKAVIPSLIELLNFRSWRIAGAALDRLRKLAKPRQDPGRDQDKWREWYRRRKHVLK